MNKEPASSVHSSVSPADWAGVWSVKLSFAAANPQCRRVLRRSFELWKDALRKQMPEDLLQSIEQAVIADDVEKLEKLVPRLRSFARGTKTSENSELGIA